MRRALLAMGIGGPLLAAVALWAAPYAIRSRDPVLACQICALDAGAGDPWGGGFFSNGTFAHGTYFRTMHSMGPDGRWDQGYVFAPDDPAEGDDVTLDVPPRMYPVAAHLLSVPSLGVAALSLVVAAFASGRRARRTPARTRARELGRSLLLVAPAWAFGIGWAVWFARERHAHARPWWTWAEQSPLLVSAAWSPLVVWFAGTLLVCHLPDADQRPSVSGSAQ